MSRGGLLRWLVAAAALAWILTEAPDGQRRLSLDLWLAVLGAWTAWRLTRRAVEAVPIEADRPRPMLTWRRRRDDGDGFVPRDLRALEGGLIAATYHPRAFSHRVRPRLRTLAEHRLRIDRGIDLDHQPEGADAVLGDLAWLLDPTVTDRAPTPTELSALLATVAPERGGPDHHGDPTSAVDPTPQDRANREDRTG